MRVLDFTGEEAAQRYEILYDGLLGTNRGFEAPSETRVVSHILDKMEAIGIPAQRGGVKTFSLNGGDKKVMLEDAEYQLMAEAIKQVKWTARAAKSVTGAMDFFAAAPNDTTK